MIPWSPGLAGRQAADPGETSRDLPSETAATGALIGGKGAACPLLQKKEHPS